MRRDVAVFMRVDILRHVSPTNTRVVRQVFSNVGHVYDLPTSVYAVSPGFTSATYATRRR